MNVLGISALFHDSAAALVVDGVVVAAAHEERFSRTKHDARLPRAAAAFCLERAGLTPADLDHVVFYEKPLRKFERILTTSLRTFPFGLRQFGRSMRLWLGDRLWLQGRLARELGVDPERVLFSDHHLSHAASAFFTSPFSRAAVLTVDGVGESATTSVHLGVSDASGHRLETLEALHFPHSIGLLYSAITAYLGFEVNEGEYKVMGLAPYGEPRFLDAFDQLAAIGDDASLTLDMRYFAYDRDPQRSFTRRLERLLGPARCDAGDLDPLNPSGPADARRFADVAASLQAFTERYLLALAHRAHALTGERDLCLAGGVALNCVANGRICRESPFDRVHAHPAAGDAGGALGAALLVSHTIAGHPRAAAPLSPFLGADHPQADVARFLTDCRIRHTRHDDPAALATTIARRLARGEVGAVSRGRFEWGPRALGARSILADPRDPAMADRVNASVKFRERFRPFAPVVLADEAPRWFALDGDRHALLTPHMLAVVPLTDAGRATLPAIAHVDGTARVQTVTPDADPDLATILTAFRAETGVGCLMNTSFNLKGEPICATPADAYSTFERSGLDFLVLEGCLIERPHPHDAHARLAPAPPTLEHAS